MRFRESCSKASRHVLTFLTAISTLVLIAAAPLWPDSYGRTRVAATSHREVVGPLGAPTGDRDRYIRVTSARGRLHVEVRNSSSVFRPESRLRRFDPQTRESWGWSVSLASDAPSRGDVLPFLACPPQTILGFGVRQEHQSYEYERVEAPNQSEMSTTTTLATVPYPLVLLLAALAPLARLVRWLRTPVKGGTRARPWYFHGGPWAAGATVASTSMLIAVVAFGILSYRYQSWARWDFRPAVPDSVPSEPWPRSQRTLLCFRQGVLEVEQETTFATRDMRPEVEAVRNSEEDTHADLGAGISGLQPSRLARWLGGASQPWEFGGFLYFGHDGFHSLITDADGAWVPMPYRLRFARVPCWALALVLSVLPLWWLTRHRRRRLRRRRAAAGLCVACGYDLRASGAMCPECGTARESRIVDKAATPLPQP